MSNDFLSDKECEELGRILFGNIENYITSFKLIQAGDAPLGFLGNHYELIITIKKKLDDSSVHTSSLFVKTKPSVKTHSDYVDEIGAFRKEILLFQDLMPKLQKVTSFLKNQWSPKCYLIKQNVLVFENLISNNYHMSNRKVLDLNHCIAVMKTLANFHSASIIFEKKENVSICEEFTDVIKEATYILEEGHTRNKWLLSGINALVLLSAMIGRNNDTLSISARVKEAVANVKPQSDSQNVLCHSDLWINNFMFRYKDGKIENCILVDYQLVRYAPPAIDVMCCLHLIAAKTMRDKHLKNLQKIYYTHLKTILKEGGIEIENVMTESKFFEDCNKYKSTALVEACLYGLCIWLPSSSAEKMLNSATKCKEFVVGDKSSVISEAFREDEFFKNQITSVLNEFLDSH